MLSIRGMFAWRYRADGLWVSYYQLQTCYPGYEWRYQILNLQADTVLMWFQMRVAIVESSYSEMRNEEY